MLVCLYHDAMAFVARYLLFDANCSGARIRKTCRGRIWRLHVDSHHCCSAGSWECLDDGGRGQGCCYSLRTTFSVTSGVVFPGTLFCSGVVDTVYGNCWRPGGHHRLHVCPTPLYPLSRLIWMSLRTDN